VPGSFPPGEVPPRVNNKPQRPPQRHQRPPQKQRVDVHSKNGNASADAGGNPSIITPPSHSHSRWLPPPPPALSFIPPHSPHLPTSNTLPYPTRGGRGGRGRGSGGRGGSDGGRDGVASGHGGRGGGRGFSSCYDEYYEQPFKSNFPPTTALPARRPPPPPGLVPSSVFAAPPPPALPPSGKLVKKSVPVAAEAPVVNFPVLSFGQPEQKQHQSEKVKKPRKKKVMQPKQEIQQQEQQQPQLPPIQGDLNWQQQDDALGVERRERKPKKPRKPKNKDSTHPPTTLSSVPPAAISSAAVAAPRAAAATAAAAAAPPAPNSAQTEIKLKKPRARNNYKGSKNVRTGTAAPPGNSAASGTQMEGLSLADVERSIRSQA
jgi:hypothetical protein